MPVERSRQVWAGIDCRSYWTSKLAYLTNDSALEPTKPAAIVPGTPLVALRAGQARVALGPGVALRSRVALGAGDPGCSAKPGRARALFRSFALDGAVLDVGARAASSRGGGGAGGREHHAHEQRRAPPSRGSAEETSAAWLPPFWRVGADTPARRALLWRLVLCGGSVALVARSAVA